MSKKQKNKVYLLSLGCPRNLVDSEVLQGEMEKRGLKIVSDPLKADTLIVNTCAFVESAKKEAIDSILSLVEIKKGSPDRKLIVTGCFSQRYPQELLTEIPEIDALFGTSDFLEIPKKIKEFNRGKKVNVSLSPSFLYDHKMLRKLIVSKNYAYLKIQEGCRNLCSYCVIPKLRGKYRSRSINSIVKEAEHLKRKNIKEIILIGQDTTLYGVDRYKKTMLSVVIKKVAAIMKNRWVRFLYAHPAHMTDADIDAIAQNPSVCKYIDLPLQHINDRILKKMNRHITRKKIIALVKKIRERIPGVILRTSLIVGFPGETKKDFNELVKFVKDMKFERLGVFEYSQEEGTDAYHFKGQVPLKEKKKRSQRIMKIQQKISLSNNMKYKGKEMTVLIESKDEKDKSLYYGRTQMDAPEIDGLCYVRSKEAIRSGSFVKVLITDVLEYDLIGERVK